MNMTSPYTDTETTLLERPLAPLNPVTRTKITLKTEEFQDVPAISQDFRQAACNLPQEARFSVSVIKARSWESSDWLSINMHVGRKTQIPVDAVPMNNTPGDTLADKKGWLQDAYTMSCRALSITFEEDRLIDGWVIKWPSTEDGALNEHFVMVHHGVDRLRAALAIETGTQFRKTMGLEPDLHRRYNNIMGPFYE